MKFGWSWSVTLHDRGRNQLRPFFYFRPVHPITNDIVPSPLQDLDYEPAEAKGIRILIKRDDLLHPDFGGNKWRKLALNIRHLRAHGLNGLVTFGGPFSNHIAATAAACKEFGIQCHLYIRGETEDRSNPVLATAHSNGATIISMDRSTFARRQEAEFIRDIRRAHPGTLIVPEGGSNLAGLTGCCGLAKEVQRQLGRPADHIFVPAGTGGTALGIVQGATDRTAVHAIAAIQSKFLQPELSRLTRLSGVASDNLHVDERFTFGGLAKWDQQLISEMLEFEERFDILLDPVYTAKMWHALTKYVENSEIKEGETAVIIHTGGQPGRAAFQYRFPGVLPV